MGKKVKEFVTYWGPSITDWNDGPEKRFAIERDEDDLKPCRSQKHSPATARHA